MEHTITVNCPECGHPDTTIVELDGYDLYQTTWCEHCSNPYAIRVEVKVSYTPYRLIKAE